MKRRSLIPFYLFLCVFLIILYYGLNPKEYDFSNHVSWNSGEPGIRFGKYGIVYTYLDSSLLQRISSQEGFTLLMAFQSDRLDNNGSGHILTLHDGNDRGQLVIWQWFSHVIAMNDTDYAHRRKIGRVSAEIPSAPAEKTHLSLATGPNGTVLYFNGTAVSTNRSLTLYFPTSIGTILALGNSIYGDGPWQGTISGLALFDRELPPESITVLYDSWIGEGNFAAAGKENPLALYMFNEGGGDRILDRAGGIGPLHIPARATPVRKKILAKYPGDPGLKGGFFKDALTNLTGFIPFGFFAAAALIYYGRITERRSVIFTVIFCASVSLAIEVLQAWIPSRTSQSLDLLLNTAGALIGAILLIKVWERLRALIPE